MPPERARRRTRVRRILWWGLGVLGAMVLLGVIGVWTLLDSASCTNADPDGQRLPESQAIDDFRPAVAKLAYEPSGPDVDDRRLHLRIHALPPFGETSSSDDARTVYVQTTVGDG